MLALKPCIITLLVVYPVFLALGWAFYRHVVRRKPHPGLQRNRQLTVLRFVMFVVLLPLGAVLAMAVLGWLDPLYRLIRREMY